MDKNHIVSFPNQLEINKIHCIDGIKGMKQLDNNSVDLTVTSPPYDNLRDYKGYKFDFKNIANELFRVLKLGGIIVWIVGDATINGSETGTSFKQALYFKEIGFNLHDTMIYEKTGASYPSINRYYQIFEYMFILSKGIPKTINLLKDKRNKWAGQENFGIRSKRNKNGILYKSEKTIVSEFGIRNNIWKYASGYGYSAEEDIAYDHPAIFPEQLAEDHILTWSSKGDLILDPMCGSGTTCKMAIRNQRNFIGFDISPEYVEIANKRISKVQRSMF